MAAMTMNEAQADAVHANENILCTACPGSGKTFVVVEKVLHIFRTYLGSPYIVLITFSREAAEQLAKRIRDPKNGLPRWAHSRLLIGTFHSIALNQLRQAKRVDRIASEAETRHYVSAALSDTGFEFELDEAENLISACKLEPSFAETNPEARELFESYDELMRRNKLMDFNDMLARAVALMQSTDPANDANPAQRHFGWIKCLRCLDVGARCRATRQKEVNMMSPANRKLLRQRGLAIFTIILAVIFLMGAITAMVAISRTNATVGTDNAKPFATAVLMQANNFAMAFQNMEQRGSLPANITYDNVATTGLLHPTSGTLTPQVPPAKAFAATATQQFWVYKGPNVKVKGVGIDANGNYAFVLTDLDTSVCQEINNSLKNSPVIPASGLASTVFVLATTVVTAPTDTTAVDMSALSAVDHSLQGCLSTTDSKNVFYVVVERQ